MKKFALALLASLALSTGAQALETGVAPKVTELGVSNPTTGLYVGNSYSFYNCGVHGYVRDHGLGHFQGLPRGPHPGGPACRPSAPGC